MKSPFERWRRTLWVWIVPLAFCILNLLGIAVYRTAYAGDVEGLERRYLASVEELEGLRRQSAGIEAALEQIEEQRQGIEHLYDGYFQTEPERFTRAVAEVKRLAREAGLDPTAFSYPLEDLNQTDLVRRGIGFSVEGTYRQLRTFINFLELTDQFLTLNSITLSETGADSNNPRLNIRMKLSTIFVDPEFQERPRT